MPAPLRVQLAPEEKRTLSELRRAGCVPYRVRDRAHMILLNADGWSAPTIAELFACHEHTARAAIRSWKAFGLGGLWEAKGRGAKPKWTEADIAYLEDALRADGRTYNSHQLATKLEAERGVSLSPTQIRRILKKRGGVGSEPAIVIETDKTQLPKRWQKNSSHA